MDASIDAAALPHGLHSLPMIHLTKALVRRWLDTLLHVADTPERTAAAFAMGVFFGFSPFLGFHTMLAIIVAFCFDLNRVAALLGVYSNLPWIIAPYYAIVTMIGAKIIGHAPPEGFKAAARVAVRIIGIPRRILASADHNFETAGSGRTPLDRFLARSRWRQLPIRWLWRS